MVTILDTNEDKLAVLARLREEKLIGPLVYSIKECTDEKWLGVLQNAWALTPWVDGKPTGIAWFDNINGYTAQSHFCLFRDHFDEAVPSGLKIIHWLEDNLHVTALTGITPKPYRQSHQLMKMWGYNEVLTLPKACYIAKHDKHVDGTLYVRIT